MKTPKYICAKCRQPFNRRWNAYRHSNNKHFGSIDNIISFTEFITNQKNSSLSLNYFYEDKNSYPRNVNNHLYFDNSISAKNIQKRARPQDACFSMPGVFNLRPTAGCFQYPVR